MYTDAGKQRNKQTCTHSAQLRCRPFPGGGIRQGAVCRRKDVAVSCLFRNGELAAGKTQYTSVNFHSN